jgi:hypothetical protein
MQNCPFIYLTITQVRYPGIDAHRGTDRGRRRRLRAILQPRTTLPGRGGGTATWRRCTGRPQIPGTLEKLYPEAVEVRANLGAALSKLGRYDEAIVQYQAVTRRER